jgi:hypothetical protein
MIFHALTPPAGLASARGVRIDRMQAAFERLGYDVTLVTGDEAHRRAAMRAVRDQLAAGRRFEFAYSEALTTPTALSEPHHLPLRPLLEPTFFRRLRRHGVRSGVFYPDVHWRFPSYRDATTAPRRAVAKAFYRFDLGWYRRYLDVVFLPSLAMSVHVPDRHIHFEALPPAGDITDLPWSPRSGVLRLVYVGGVSRGRYNIDALVSAVDEVEGVHLTVCCPPGSQEHIGVDHRRSGRIEVVHAASDMLPAMYAASDVACLYYDAFDTYREFAVPLKLFEAVGMGRPVLCSPGSAAAALADLHGLGWTPPATDLPALLRRLRDDSTLLDDTRQHVLAAQHLHTWTARAADAARVLGGSITEHRVVTS